MSKEELIKLIETLEFDEIIDIKMSYKKKKENIWNDEYEIKTICFDNDLEEKMYSIKDNLEYRISDLYNAILKKEE